MGKIECWYSCLTLNQVVAGSIPASPTRNYMKPQDNQALKISLFLGAIAIAGLALGIGLHLLLLAGAIKFLQYIGAV